MCRRLSAFSLSITPKSATLSGQTQKVFVSTAALLGSALWSLASSSRRGVPRVYAKYKKTALVCLWITSLMV